MNVGLESLQLIWLYVEHFFCTSSLVLTNAAIFSLFSQRGGAAAPAPSSWMFCENYDWTDSRTMAASCCGSASVSDRSCRSLRIRSCSVCSARTSAVRTSRECKRPRSSSQYTGFMISCVFMMNLSVIDICMCVCVMKGWGVQCRISPYEWPSAPKHSDRLHPTVPLESARRYWTDALSCVSLTCPGQISSLMTFCSDVMSLSLCLCVCAGAACVSVDSSQWLIRNFGQFSALVPLNLLISLNTQFSPVQAHSHCKTITVFIRNAYCFPIRHPQQTWEAKPSNAFLGLCLWTEVSTEQDTAPSTVLLLKYMFRCFTEKQGRDILNRIRVLTLYFFCLQLSSLLALSPEQLVGLMFDDVPGLPEKSVIINAVFDHLIAYPEEARIKSTLYFLVESSKTVKGFFGTLSHLFLMSVQSLTSGRVSFRGTSPVRRIRSCECVVTCCFMCWISQVLMLTRLSVCL